MGKRTRKFDSNRFDIKFPPALSAGSMTKYSSPKQSIKDIYSMREGYNNDRNMFKVFNSKNSATVIIANNDDRLMILVSND